MTQLSCMNAAVDLLQQALPEFTRVDLTDNVPRPYTPDLYPLALVDFGEEREDRFGVPIASSTSPGGHHLAVWPLLVDLWTYEPGPQWDPTPFLGYVQTVKKVFSTHPAFGGKADTDGTFVLTVGEGRSDAIRSTVRRVIARTGGLVRHAEISVLIREGVAG